MSKKFTIDFGKLSDEQVGQIIDMFVDQHPNDFADLMIEAHHFELSCEKVQPVNPVKLILGNITFLDPQIDGEHKAIVHEVSGVIECPDEDTAMKIGEDMLCVACESYLVPTTYSGEIEYECLVSCSLDANEIN